MINTSRICLAQGRMRDLGIDAYLILTHDDYTYFFGEDRFQPRAVIPAAGDPIVVTFVGEEAEVRESLGSADVKVFGSVGQQIKDVVGAMRELAKNRESMTVGVQMWFNTPAFLLNLFQRANPDINVVDIAPVMDELRMVKDESEVELMRRASAIAATGIETATVCLRPGITENEVGAEIEYAMRKAGGSGVATPVFVNSGIRSGWLHGTASQKVVEAGDLVVVDVLPYKTVIRLFLSAGNGSNGFPARLLVVPRYRGYCANLTRTFVIGKATPQQREMLDTYRRAQSAGVAALRPGVRNRDIDSAAQEIFTQAGYGDLYISGISHSIGLDFEEKPRPTIHPADFQVELRVGMTVTVGHSVLSVPGVGGVRIEDTYLLNEDGPERLTDFDWEDELAA